MITKTKLIGFLKEALVPFLLLILGIGFLKFGSYLSLPSQNQLISLIVEFINNQSLFLIFIIALIEGSVVVGQYFPGSVILFLSIISAGKDLPRIFAIVIIISLAFFLAYSIDFFIGYYGLNFILEKLGWGKTIGTFRRSMEKNLFATIFFAYFDTNLASLASVSAGILRISIKKYLTYSFISLVFWNIFWAILLFIFGEFIIQFIGIQYILFVLLIWIGWIFYKHFVRKTDITNF